ncbi:hypothetical protein PIB30_052612 [Stylosanthes scabra]|uniref:Uncharacterized protein n=1 Tax=Stylosanthes scabra TaxID=79078 RepID=A0ABU6SID6_9FABA|nr:hypothetical protein [Stylosanthes scabra]
MYLQGFETPGVTGDTKEEGPMSRTVAPNLWSFGGFELCKLSCPELLRRYLGASVNVFGRVLVVPIFWNLLGEEVSFDLTTEISTRRGSWGRESVSSWNSRFNDGP